MLLKVLCHVFAYLDKFYVKRVSAPTLWEARQRSYDPTAIGTHPSVGAVGYARLSPHASLTRRAPSAYGLSGVCVHVQAGVNSFLVKVFDQASPHPPLRRLRSRTHHSRAHLMETSPHRQMAA